MGRSLTQSQGGVGGRMGKNGDVPKMHILTPNTVSAICIVAETVQESLWNLKLLLNRCQLRCHKSLPLAALVVIEATKTLVAVASRTQTCIPTQIRGVLILGATYRSCS